MKQVTRKIGILNLQGGVVEHLDHLQRLGLEGVLVKNPEQLCDLAGLILPGGESTCLFKLMTIFGLDNAISAEHQRGMKLWGTCAGAILLAAEVVGESAKLGLIDITVERNAFGSQLDSFATVVRIPEVSPDELPLTFIRAPKIIRTGSNVKVLLRQRGYTAMAETNDILVTVFHPELTPCLAFHRHFARMCGLLPAAADNAGAKSADSTWTLTSWTRHTRVSR